jgi:hypothetical protein
MNIVRMIIKGETCPSTVLSTTHPTLIVQGMNPRLLDDKSDTNQLM